MQIGGVEEGERLDLVGFGCVLEASPVTLVGATCALTGRGGPCDQRTLGKDAKQG